MKKTTYIKMTQPFRDFPKLAKSVHITNQIMTGIVVAAYGSLLLYLLWQKDVLLYRSIIVPLDGFLLVSAFRFFMNRPRPYEKFQMQPGIVKNTKGKSFPSRHVYSAVLIAGTFCVQTSAVLQAAGILLLVLAALLALLRVLSGVHYISDVLVGYMLALLTAWLGFIVIK